MPFDRRLYH